jgi:hypothetical protein
MKFIISKNTVFVILPVTVSHVIFTCSYSRNGSSRHFLNVLWFSPFFVFLVYLCNFCYFPVGSDGCNVLTTILETILKMPIHSKSRYIGLAVLANEIGCQALIDRIPNLVQSLLNSLADPILNTHVSVTKKYVRYFYKTQSSKSGPLCLTLWTFSSSVFMYQHLRMYVV